MVVLDKLRRVGNYVRKGWGSTNPDSYSHYKRGHERQRKQAERSREVVETGVPARTDDGRPAESWATVAGCQRRQHVGSSWG